ncbi:MAG: hypothetical protein HUJ27_10450 [Rhodobacteraceae bacterium]|nr:hypothetical protein [Paracoccaceae bacterium]
MHDLPKEVAGYGAIHPPRDLARRTSRKLLPDLEAAISASGLKDGDTVSFHHHLRNGDNVLNTVLDALTRRGLRNLDLAVTSIFPVHAPLVDRIRSGVIGRISASFISGVWPKPSAAAPWPRALRHAWLSAGGRGQRAPRGGGDRQPAALSFDGGGQPAEQGRLRRLHRQHRRSRWYYLGRDAAFRRSAEPGHRREHSRGDRGQRALGGRLLVPDRGRGNFAGRSGLRGSGNGPARRDRQLRLGRNHRRPRRDA